MLDINKIDKEIKEFINSITKENMSKKIPLEGVTYEIFMDAFVNQNVQNLIKKNELRQGQALFNLLETYQLDLVNKIRGTDLDPYYDEQISQDVHNYLIENWS